MHAVAPSRPCVRGDAVVAGDKDLGATTQGGVLSRAQNYGRFAPKYVFTGPLYSKPLRGRRVQLLPRGGSVAMCSQERPAGGRGGNFTPPSSFFAAGPPNTRVSALEANAPVSVVRARPLYSSGDYYPMIREVSRRIRKQLNYEFSHPPQRQGSTRASSTLTSARKVDRAPTPQPPSAGGRCGVFAHIFVRRGGFLR